MGKTKKFLSFFCMTILAADFMIFAESAKLSVNGAITISKDNPRYSYDYDTRTQEEIVSTVEDIELPLHQKDYGKYYDDFNRRVANEIRKEAKDLYQEQEKAKELTDIKDAVMPLYKVSNFCSDNYYNNRYSCCYDTFSSDSSKYNVVFYDALGRKLSDDLAIEANRLYEKQVRKRDLSSWGYTSMHDIWRYLWSTVRFIIVIMILFFVAKIFYQKVIKK